MSQAPCDMEAIDSRLYRRYRRILQDEVMCTTVT